MKQSLPRIAVLFLMAALVAFAVALLALGVWPIWVECGRLPHGQGEAINRLFGLSLSCA